MSFRGELRFGFFATFIKSFISLSLILNATVGAAFAQDYNNPNEGGQDVSKSAMLFQRAKQAFAGGDYAAAVQILEAAKNFNSGDKNIFHMEALAYAELGDNYNAMTQFLAALTLDYNFLECRNNYGIFLQKTGKVKEAKKEFETCIQINPNYANPHYGRGSILKEEKDLDGAIEEFRTALHLRPQYYEAKRDLGLCIYEQYEQGKLKDINESREQLEGAARLIPKSPMVHYYLGKVWCAEGNLDEGEKEFRLTLFNDPMHAAGHYELGRLRYLRGDIDRCMDEMDEAMKVNPTYTESKNYPLINRKEIREFTAKCKELKRWWTASAKDWLEVAQQTKFNEPILAHIKELQKLTLKKQKSKKAPLYDEDEVNALIKRAISETDEGQLQEAKATFNRCLEINPNCWEAYQHLGLILVLEGDFTRALKNFQKAIEIEPGYAGLYYNMGYVLERVHLPVEAGRMYRKFHEIDGKYPYDPKHINQLQLEDVRQQMRNNAAGGR
ncbi:MAG: tetratricopeptide repeat protein [Candidatus Obscuribacterales bacterium]|nr:tetratricopeptide repeat protein [Candidatus Obscuribacterales bacterium]